MSPKKQDQLRVQAKNSRGMVHDITAMKLATSLSGAVPAVLASQECPLCAADSRTSSVMSLCLSLYALMRFLLAMLLSQCNTCFNV